MQRLSRNRTLPALAVAALVWATGLPGGPVAAQAPGDIYSVGGIAVDETGADGSAARAAALRSGERVAFDRLLRWLLLDRDVAQIPSDVRADPSGFVTGYSVQSERIAANRYRATIEVQFDPNRVRGLMNELELSFEERRPPTHLLIPLFDLDGRLDLWDHNPWLDVWADRPGTGDFIPLLVPHGDIGDVSALSAADAAGGQADRIAGLARRYGVTRALLVRADQAADDGHVLVSVRLVDRGQPIAEPLHLRLNRAVDETDGELLQRAAATTARAAADLWIQSVRDRRQTDGVLAVRADFASHAEWRRLLGELLRSSRLADVTVRRLTTRQADLALAYSGTPEAVRAALAAIGLDVETDDAPWRVRFAAEPEPPPATEPAPEAPVVAPPPVTPIVD